MRRATAALMVLGLSVVPSAAVSSPPSSVAMIVGWEREVLPASRSAAHRHTGATVTGSIPALAVERVQMETSDVDVYRQLPGVTFVEPVRSYRIFDRPSDPLLPYQWAFEVLGIRKAWRHETGARSPVLVAVIDTGIDAAHPDLAGRLRPGIDLVDGDQDPHDPNGHGTHVAGIVAANTDNRVGIAGMSWGAKVLPVRVCRENGACDGFAVVAGMVDAILTGADVVNLSLGSPGTACSQLETLVATMAESEGVLLVAAAGNSAQQDNPVNYPAACPGYLGVGATTPGDEIAPFSSYGDYVDVAAPGVGIFSTLPPASTQDTLFPGYGPADGTSMAAPHVAGLAALLWSQNPAWSPARIQQRIERTAVDLGRKGRDVRFGAGRIDVRAALSRR